MDFTLIFGAPNGAPLQARPSSPSWEAASFFLAIDLAVLHWRKLNYAVSSAESLRSLVAASAFALALASK